MKREEIIKGFGNKVYYQNTYYMGTEVPTNRMIIGLEFVYRGMNISLINKDEKEDTIRETLTTILRRSDNIDKSEYNTIIDDLDIIYNEHNKLPNGLDTETSFIFTILLMTAVKNGLLVSDGQNNGMCLVTKIKEGD